MASRDREGAEQSPPTWFHRALWLILPAFASVSLLATTNHVSIDVTPMPFLWVMPLSLYLAHVHHRLRPSTLVLADRRRHVHADIHFLGMVYSQDESLEDLQKTGVPGKIVEQCCPSLSKTAEKTCGEMMNRPKRPDCDRISDLRPGLFRAVWHLPALPRRTGAIAPTADYLTAFYLPLLPAGRLAAWPSLWRRAFS